MIILMTFIKTSQFQRLCTFLFSSHHLPNQWLVLKLSSWFYSYNYTDWLSEDTLQWENKTLHSLWLRCFLIRSNFLMLFFIIDDNVILVRIVMFNLFHLYTEDCIPWLIQLLILASNILGFLLVLWEPACFFCISLTLCAGRLSGGLRWSASAR